jgi:hypothetical protein
MCEDSTLLEFLSVHPPAYLAYKLFAMFFTIMGNYAKMLGQNYFVKSNWHVLTHLHPILIRRLTYWTPGGLLLHLDILPQ